jgi:osmotically inducible protein OsmC
MPKALGGKEEGSNPEQLFAAGYAACFQSAMAFVAGKQKIPLTGSTSDRRGRPAAAGGRLQAGSDPRDRDRRSEQADAEALVATAHKVCPYSNATRGNIDVALTVKAK